MLRVQFLALEGRALTTVKTEDYPDLGAATAAVTAYVTPAGYTGVKVVDDESDDFSLRFTARTPNGRPGRNVALADQFGLTDQFGEDFGGDES